MKFDPYTLFAVTAMFTLLLGLVNASIWWMRRAQPGFGRWTAGNLLIVLCLPLAASRAFAPDWIGIVGADLALVTAMVLYLEGTRTFCAHRTFLWPVYVLAAVTMVAVTYFDYVAPDLNIRITVVSSFVALICLACAVTLSRDRSTRHSIGTALTTGAFGLCALILICRAFYFIFGPSYTDLFAPTPINGFFLVCICLSLGGCPIGFILMADERLMSDLREAESKVSRANHELAEALESAKSHAQRAAQADAAKTEFVGILAHEIRNPLAVIISMAEALCDAGLSTEQQEYSESVHRSAERLLALTEDALDLSRIERGRLTIQADPFDLQSVLEEVGALFARSAKEKAILLAIEYPVSAPRRFVGDSGRIRQVVVNLVTNSLKFTSSGHVRISAACEDGGHECVPVRVAVADSGMGIPPERLGSLFEMFSSSCDGAAGPRKGSGLGLTICKRLVEQMGGDIHVESEPGKGSRFWFELRLPVVRQSSAPVGG